MYKLYKQLLCISIFLIGSYIDVNAQIWTDSVYLKIDNPIVGTNSDGKTCLSFDLNIFRPNDNWIGGDIDLGTSTFVFKGIYGDLDDIFDGQSLTEINPLLQGGSSYLGIVSYFVRGKLYITLKESHVGGNNFTLDLQQDKKICKVVLPLKDPTTTQIGLVWDEGSVMTKTNNATIPTYFGEVLVRPGKFLSIDSYSPDQTVCEGADIVLYAHANTTGTGLTYEWSDSIPGVPGRTSLGKQSGAVSRRTHAAWGCDYEICGKGDTLKIYNASAKLDSAIFKCIAQDVSLGSTLAENSRSVEIKLQLRDRFYAFLTDYATNKMYVSGDSVFRCPGEIAKARILVGGMQSNLEYKNETGEVCVRYIGRLNDGNVLVDTAKFSINMFSMSPDKKMYAYDKNLFIDLEKDGIYYVDKVWTDCCENADSYPALDTVFVKERNFELHVVDPVTVSVNSNEEITPIGISWTNVDNSNTSLGTPWEDAGKVYYSASSTPGTDTVFYTKTVDKCKVSSEQQVNIVSEKYLSINVILEGAYYEAADSMYCVWKDDFPPVVSTTIYESPYPDHMQINRPFPSFGKAICDWVYVELWDYPPYGLGGGDTKMGTKIDSISALLLSDGTICSAKANTDGTGNKYVIFQKLPDDDYYVVVKHKSHIAIMSKEKVHLMPTPPVIGAFPMIDFSGKSGKTLTSADDVFDNENGLGIPVLKVVNGRKLMFVGDVDTGKGSGDGNIDAVDVQALKAKLGSSGYNDGDLNFDGTVNASDMQKCKANVGKYVKY